MNIPKYIKSIKRGVVCCVLQFTLLPYCYAVEGVAEEASGKPVMMLHFRFDKSLVDSSYMDNGRVLRYLDGLFADLGLCARIDSINILSFASPDGDRAYNERLAKQRSASVKGYLVWKYPHLDQYRIHPYPQGENWQEFRRLIESDKYLPNRKEVLQIIDRHPDNDRCKALLRKLDGGSSYRYIQEKMSRYLRNAAVCMVWIRPDSLPALPEPVSPNVEALNQPCESLHTGMKRFQEQQEQTMRNVQVTATEKSPLFAVKTNLLFDAVIMPNIEIEVPIGRRWSVNGEYMFPWWLLKDNRYCLEILSGGLEGRYWLGSSQSRKHHEVLTGHFVGLYAGGGEYDLQWKENGYQGEFFIAAGISYGWATCIARNLHLEFSIGIGLLRTDYRHYHARDNYNTLLWQENGNYTWFGPTKAKISLVWLLNRKVKKGGAR